MHTTMSFEGEENLTKNAEIKITAKKNQALSKDELAFNRLIGEIEKMEKGIGTEEEKLDRLLQHYLKNVNPVEQKGNEMKMSFAFTLDHSCEKSKYSAKVLVWIEEIICALCSGVFQDREPTEEEIALYNRWSDVDYEEEMEEVKAFESAMFSDYINRMYGEEIDPDEIDLEDPESMARLKARLDEKLRNKLEEEAQVSQQETKKKKKTKKQLQKEQLEKEKEALKGKSLRGIYIALSKILHPDKESNEELRAEKEELMKEVTAAYERKDLSTLLKLEIRCLYNTSEHLSEIGDSKLKLFIEVLRERKVELEREKFMLWNSPRYIKIRDFTHLMEKSALGKINKIVREKKEYQEGLEKNIAVFNKLKTKKEYNEFIELMHMDMVDYDDEDFFDFL